MVNDAVVSIISTDFYGRSKRFKLEDISEETLVQWAVETKQLLLANPELAKTKRIIEDSISPEAKESLWSCSEKLAEVPKEYPAALRTVAERQAFHLEWLDKIVAACAHSSGTCVQLNHIWEGYGLLVAAHVAQARPKGGACAHLGAP